VLFFDVLLSRWLSSGKLAALHGFSPNGLVQLDDSAAVADFCLFLQYF
jgi:hypothetical protein